MDGEMRKAVKAGVKRSPLYLHWINIMIGLYAELKLLDNINH